jgi:predicted membrane protein
LFIYLFIYCCCCLNETKKDGAFEIVNKNKKKTINYKRKKKVIKILKLLSIDLISQQYHHYHGYHQHHQHHRHHRFFNKNKRRNNKIKENETLATNCYSFFLNQKLVLKYKDTKMKFDFRCCCC